MGGAIIILIIIGSIILSIACCVFVWTQNTLCSRGFGKSCSKRGGNFQFLGNWTPTDLQCVEDGNVSRDGSGSDCCSGKGASASLCLPGGN